MAKCKEIQNFKDFEDCLAEGGNVKQLLGMPPDGSTHQGTKHISKQEPQPGISGLHEKSADESLLRDLVYPIEIIKPREGKYTDTVSYDQLPNKLWTGQPPVTMNELLPTCMIVPKPAPGTS